MYYIKASKILLVFASLLIEFPHSQCHSINDTYRLLKDKLANYDKTIRPTSNQSKATIVYFSFMLTFFQEFDEVDQRLSVVGLVGLYWTDDMMKWDPAQYGNLTKFLTESGRFWTPNLILVNNADPFGKIGGEWQTIRYKANGSALYRPMEMFSVSCEVDVTLYPWDRHFCFISFMPQNYLPTELLINKITDKVDMAYYTPNGAWNYVDSYIDTFISPYFSIVSVGLLFERKSRFVIVNVILPIILIAFLSVFVLLIPPDSGERISYTITMLLAITVFLTLVGDNLPKTSTNMPILCYYLITMLATNICITMFTIFNLRLYHADTREPVSGRWARLAMCCKAKKKRTISKTFSGSSKTISNSNIRIHSDSSSVYVTEEGIKEEVDGQIKEHITNDQEKFEKHQKQSQISTEGVFSNNYESENQDNTDIITWKHISFVLDKILFFLFCIIFIVATVVYFVIVVGSDHKIPVAPAFLPHEV